MRPSDHYKMVLHEPTSVGIKPEVAKTDGGHLKFTFMAGGNRESIVTSSTPSAKSLLLHAVDEPPPER